MARTTDPSVYAIAPGRPFLDLLAHGILQQQGGDPLTLSRVTVLLPTRRACRALAEAFLRQSDGTALLLPVIRPLGDVDEDELELRGKADERSDALPFGTLERSLLLARLVQASPLAGGDSANALRLARELGHLLDAAATEEVGLDRLPDLVPAELAGHWQQTLDFLKIVRETWPAIKAEQGRSDSAEHRQHATQRWIEHWQKTPPTGPVIAAGSTGTIPATARLLKLISRLPQGSIILPGLDRGLDEAAWAAVQDEPTHPQHALARLLDTLGVMRDDVVDWPHSLASAGKSDQGRAGLLTAALLPPAESHRWRDLRGGIAADALAGLQRIDAPGPREEALSIALAMRETLETPGRTAALITPDRMLARRVCLELARYGITVDDSAGMPLIQTAPAVFLRLLAAAVAEDFAAVPLLALLKHPFCRVGMARGDLLRWTRRVERKLLRRSRPAVGLVQLVSDLASKPDLLPPLARLAAIAETMQSEDGQTTTLKTLLQVQVIAAEALTVAPDQPTPLWQQDAGEALHALVVDLLDASDQFGAVTPAEWPRLLDALLEGQVVRPRRPSHSRLAIWGLLEARLQQADRIILGGLNEGTWPPQAKEDPWLSRPMRAALGLSSPEFRLGQTAHDFVQAASGGDVILTRAAKVDGTPTVPARWLLRLEALLDEKDVRWQGSLAPQYLAWAEQLDTPAQSLKFDPPKPAPPVTARPRSLPVTDIETWIRDPYAIYAKRVLGLRRLDPPDQPPDARLRGNVIHAVLEKFQQRHMATLPDDAAALNELFDLGRIEFGTWLEQPDIAALWWPRFERAMRWFLAYERERRSDGFRPALLETKGATELVAPGGAFTLEARADRIDRHDVDGRLAILDYKTGNPPTPKQVNSGLAPQLALEAAIAQAGGFEGLSPAGIAELVYIRLGGGAEPGEAKRIEGTSRTEIPPADDLAREALARLSGWVAWFDDETKPYLSRPRPQFVDYPGDYDHLARVAERAEGTGEGQ
ncbi:double-strand break repair protein AddB [Ferrovibrio terrae]|uniref:Double-strand break repair protein AddB n=1 Tax=Ferrovibrio terrae TaxID=2594003 RepID=A0A516GXC9_9PROT|nr:double-strand break repair protein AddB [Ferrovibrio terrae]QDO96208.1 double-strand break repair protein AddB [Ferrovibrio terrae]